jgi:hypothetical protein
MGPQSGESKTMSQKEYWKGTLFLFVLFFAVYFLVDLATMHWTHVWGTRSVRASALHSVFMSLFMAFLLPPGTRFLKRFTDKI